MHWKGCYTGSLRAIEAVPVVVQLVLFGGCKKSNSAHGIRHAGIEDDYLPIDSHTPLHDEIPFADSSVRTAFSLDFYIHGGIEIEKALPGKESG